MSFAILEIKPSGEESGDHFVVEWAETAEAAIERATELNETTTSSGRFYRAVFSQTNGLWRSLTGESLYEGDDEDDDECSILIEVDGPPSGENVGTCRCGRPIYRSLIAGTIYHATDDGMIPRHVDDDGTVHPATRAEQ